MRCVVILLPLFCVSLAAQVSDKAVEVVEHRVIVSSPVKIENPPTAPSWWVILTQLGLAPVAAALISAYLTSNYNRKQWERQKEWERQQRELEWQEERRRWFKQRQWEWKRDALSRLPSLFTNAQGKFMFLSRLRENIRELHLLAGMRATNDELQKKEANALAEYYIAHKSLGDAIFEVSLIVNHGLYEAMAKAHGVMSANSDSINENWKAIPIEIGKVIELMRTELKKSSDDVLN